MHSSLDKTNGITDDEIYSNWNKSRLISKMKALARYYNSGKCSRMELTEVSCSLMEQW